MSPLAVWGLTCVLVGSALTLGWVLYARSSPVTRVRLTGVELVPVAPLAAPWQSGATHAVLNVNHVLLRATWPLASVWFDGTSLTVQVAWAKSLTFVATADVLVFPSRVELHPCISVSVREVLMARFGVRQQAAFLTMMALHGFTVDWVERKGLETRGRV